jgi:hypothetical protein
MAAARRFANVPTLAHLDSSKMKALTVLDDEEIQELENGNPVRGMTRDAIEAMSVKELRENLRKERTALKKEKQSRQRDREIQEKAIAQKESKINELDQQLRYQQPPTKEQTALAGLAKLAVPYTYAIAEINAAIRTAYAIAQQAEATIGADVQMLSEWFGQYSREMGIFAELREAWTDEVDNAKPIDVGSIKEAGDVPELG